MLFLMCSHELVLTIPSWRIPCLNVCSGADRVQAIMMKSVFQPCFVDDSTVLVAQVKFVLYQVKVPRDQEIKLT